MVEIAGKPSELYLKRDLQRYSSPQVANMASVTGNAPPKRSDKPTFSLCLVRRRDGGWVDTLIAEPETGLPIDDVTSQVWDHHRFALNT